jgi:hypothetical protein
MDDGAKKVSWWAGLFRSKAKLTYWLGSDVYVVEVSKFTEKKEDCIVFIDYYTQKTIMVKHSQPISYVLEEIK